jgi:hypothetical protein
MQPLPLSSDCPSSEAGGAEPAAVAGSTLRAHVLVTRSFVFVHVPKTGGSFIQAVTAEHLAVVYRSDYTHAPYGDLPEQWRDLPACCVIRNPWDWYVSWFHYAMKSPRKRGARLRSAPIAPGREEIRRDKRAVWENLLGSGSASFEEAVTRACAGDFDHPLASMIRKEGIDLYSAYLKTIAGDGLDRPNFTALRFERLRAELLRYVRNHADPPKRLRAAIRHAPPLKASEHGPYHLYYDDRLRALVAEKARWMCERFGYEYEGVPARLA